MSVSFLADRRAVATATVDDGAPVGTEGPSVLWTEWYAICELRASAVQSGADDQRSPSTLLVSV